MDRRIRSPHSSTMTPSACSPRSPRSSDRAARSSISN